MWAGLGYYRRAKYLHNGAQYVVNSCGGKLPTTVAGLLKVPGIGQYTAGLCGACPLRVSFRIVTSTRSQVPLHPYHMGLQHQWLMAMLFVSCRASVL